MNFPGLEFQPVLLFAGRFDQGLQIGGESLELHQSQFDRAHGFEIVALLAQEHRPEQRRDPLRELDERLPGAADDVAHLTDHSTDVTIPRGVDSGSRIRLSGKGPDGRDLVVITRLLPHKTFARTGADLEREVAVTLEEALLGGEIHVGTLKGRVALKLPEGTQNGRKFRLKGQGMPRLKGEDAGDLYVRVKVVLPTHLSEEAKDAARRFLDLADEPDPLA